MAIAIVDTLVEPEGEIRRSELVKRFVSAYQDEPWRGYGSGARKLLEQVGRGQSWQQAGRKLFGDTGSYGNGAAMRVAPLGAWFAHDLNALREQATRSAEVTHQHREGVAGAIAIAAAAASAWLWRDEPLDLAREQLFEKVIEQTPASEVSEKIEVARSVGLDATIVDVCSALGTRLAATAVETVPFVIWSAARHLRSYGEGLWRTAAAGGDHDTTCAMVGGIVALATGIGGIPPVWLARTEALPLELRWGDGVV